MAVWQERSPTKRPRINAPTLSGCESLTYPLIPRVKGWGAEFVTSVPRTAVGINEYFYALSRRDHDAVRCVAGHCRESGRRDCLRPNPTHDTRAHSMPQMAHLTRRARYQQRESPQRETTLQRLQPRTVLYGTRGVLRPATVHSHRPCDACPLIVLCVCSRACLSLRMGGRRGDTRWEVEPTAASPPLSVLIVKMHQQFESPPAVVATVRRLWRPDFDAMATPFSAVCARYAAIPSAIPPAAIPPAIPPPATPPPATPPPATPPLATTAYPTSLLFPPPYGSLWPRHQPGLSRSVSLASPAHPLLCLAWPSHPRPPLPLAHTDAGATTARSQRDLDAISAPPAVCARYATLEDDVLSHCDVPAGAVIYINPAYAPKDLSNGADGIGPYLTKLIVTDVGKRGCTLVALLPNLSHTEWHERLVGSAHEIHFIRGALVFPNPFTDVEQRKKGYLWEARSYIICVWRPGPPPTQPALAWLTLDQAPAERIELRSCCLCGRVRLLPRWCNVSDLRPGAFRCADSPDRRYNSCEVPEFVLRACP